MVMTSCIGAFTPFRPAGLTHRLFLPQGAQHAGDAPSVAAASVGSVRVATWNVNSVKQRVDRLLPWLDQRRPDVVCLQETKLPDAAFAELLGDSLASRGYEFAAHGEAQWNGVALLSRVGLDDVTAGFDGDPGFPDPQT